MINQPVPLIAFTTLFAVAFLSATASGAEGKFRPLAAQSAVIGRYVVTLDSSVDAEHAAASAEALARAYEGQLQPSASSDRSRFSIAMLPARARSLSADPRVRAVIEVTTQDDLEARPQVLNARQLVPVARDTSTNGVYTYDGAGNITAIGNDTFFYDKIGRLVDATIQANQQGNQQKYTYDIYGNRLTADRIGTAVNCLGNTTCEAAVAVEASTNHLSGVAYDAAGNVISGYDAVYVYDGAGMVTKATVGSDVRNFAYTADDERIAIKQGLSWTWSVRDHSDKVLREFTSLESTSPFALSNHTWLKDYVYRTGQLLASVSVPAGLSTPVTYHYHLDHLGTPRMITRDGAILVSKHTYYPFGAEMNLTPQENPAEAMKFTGHERDIVAGSNHSVDYMHARYYNPNLGRFLEVDPGPYDTHRPLTWNRYAYVMNSPMNKTDPSGKCFWDLCVGEAALVLAGTAAILTTATVYLNHQSSSSPGRTNGQVLAGSIASAVTIGKVVTGMVIATQKPLLDASTHTLVSLSERVRKLGEKARQGNVDAAADQLDSLQDRQRRIRQGTAPGIVEDTTKSEQRLKETLKRIPDYKTAKEDEEEGQEEQPEAKKTPADEKKPPEQY